MIVKLKLSKTITLRKCKMLKNKVQVNITQDLTKKWIMPIKDWSSIFTELNIMFEDRMSCFLEYNKYTESKED